MNQFRDDFIYSNNFNFFFFLKNLNEIFLSSSRSEESRPPTACPASDSAVRWMAVRQPLEMNYFHLQEVTKNKFHFLLYSDPNNFPLRCIPVMNWLLAAL